MFADLVEEFVGLSDAALIDRMEANELDRRRLDAEMSAALAVADARNLHGASGHRTMTSFCRAKLNWSTTEAGRRRCLSRAANGVPGLGQAWIEGRFGFPQAMKLSMTHANERVADRLGEFAPELLRHAEQMPYADFVTVVDHFVERADEDGSHDERDLAVEGRTARVVDVGGSLDIRATGGDGLVTAELMEIHRRFVDIEFRKDIHESRSAWGDDADAHPLPRTDRQRRFDALVAIFRAAGEVGDVGSPAEALVNIVVDADTWGRMILAAGLSTSTDLDGRPIDPFTGLAVEDTVTLVDELTDPSTRHCETTNGVALHPHDVLRAALAGHVRRTVVDADRVVIDLGRRQRLFTGNARQAAKLLVRRCEHVGCELPGDWCEVDHDAEWDRDGGSTDQRNAAVLCRFHNNDKHRHRWRTRRARNGCSYTIDESGTLVLPVGARSPDFGTPADPRGDAHDGPFDDPWGDMDTPADVARLTAIARDRVHALTAR